MLRRSITDMTSSEWRLISSGARRSTGKPRSVTIAADRGWQSSGVWLEAGKSYHVTASGRYQIAAEKSNDGEKAWPCEPGGVTIEYHDGRPLGMLLGAMVEGARNGERGASEEGGRNVGARQFRK